MTSKIQDSVIENFNSDKVDAKYFDKLWKFYGIAISEVSASRQSMQTIISWSLLSATIIIGSFSFLKRLSSDRYAFLCIGWLLVFGASLLGSSQYVGEFNRFLRARFYARKIEDLMAKKNFLDCLDNEKPWVQYICENEFKGKSYMSALGALIGLTIAQFSPFLIYIGRKSDPLDPRWLSLPLFGVLLILLLCTYFVCQSFKKYDIESFNLE